MSGNIKQAAAAARRASQLLATTPEAVRDEALAAIAAGLEAARERIETANAEDLQAAAQMVAAGELAGAARDAVEEAGFGDYPSHSLGHGIGLQIHEPPWLRVGNEARLQEGEVVTVEPGVYVPNLGGVRIEDAVLVTDEGSRSLTHAPRELLELG